MRKHPCTTVLCWMCGSELRVNRIREDRRPKTDGYNTVCGDIRVCQPCDQAIQRFKISSLNGSMSKHLRALG